MMPHSIRVKISHDCRLIACWIFCGWNGFCGFGIWVLCVDLAWFLVEKSLLSPYYSI